MSAFYSANGRLMTITSFHLFAMRSPGNQLPADVIGPPHFSRGYWSSTFLREIFFLLLFPSVAWRVVIFDEYFNRIKCAYTLV